MLTKELSKSSMNMILITDDQYLITAMIDHFYNIQHFSSSNLVNYITSKENNDKIVLVDDRYAKLKILNYRNISRENDFLIILRSSVEGKRKVPCHYEAIIDLSVSTVCFCNRLRKYLYIFSKAKNSTFPRKNILNDTETEILKLLCTRKTPKEIAETHNLSLASTYRYIKNIVNKYDYKKLYFFYDDLLKNQDAT